MPTDAPQPESLAKVLPDLDRACRRDSLIGWAAAAVVAAVSVGVPWALTARRPDWQETELAPHFLGACLGVAAILKIARWVRRRHEARIVPRLTKAAGLSYAQTANRFAAQVPGRLLPVGDRTGEDLVQGNLAGCQLACAEVCVTSGGSKPVPLFQGIVARVTFPAPAPVFLIAPEKNSEDSFFKGRNVDVTGLSRRHSLKDARGIRFGLWTDGDKPDEATVAAIADLQDRLGPEFRLHGAFREGATIHVALTVGRDLLRVGGLFAGKARRLKDIKQAYDDLTLPLTIAKALLQTKMPET